MAMNTANAAKSAASLERQIQALELRRAGLGFEAIGAKLGIKKSQAHRLVQAGLADCRAQVAANADELRSEEVSRLDGMLQGLWPRARKGEAAAVDRVLKIMERRSRLLGLDAPERRELSAPGGAPLLPPSTIDASKLSAEALEELLAVLNASTRKV